MIGAATLTVPQARAETGTRNEKERDEGDSSSSKTTYTVSEIVTASSKRALKGGVSGASAAVIQVLTLMWLRTIMNYQYRYGGSLSSALTKLYGEGGIPRLYQGLPFAIVQGPITRFGDTAANMGMLALLESLPQTAYLPLFVRTGAGSLAAGAFRILVMPIDTAKTAMQVEGREGLSRLARNVVRDRSVSALYQGALATAAATAVGHYPWFLTYNFLNDALPLVDKQEVLMGLARSAFLGLAASCVSDTCSNSLRVIKTTKQTAALAAAPKDKDSDDESDKIDKKKSVAINQQISYSDALKLVLEKDGVKGLFGRGLQTRLITNMIQGAAFSVLWKYFQTVQS